MNKLRTATVCGIALTVLATPAVAMAGDYTSPVVPVVTPPAVLGTTVTAAPAPPPAAPLPFTGADVGGLVVLGGGLVGAGLVLVRRNRSKSASS